MLDRHLAFHLPERKLDLQTLDARHELGERHALAHLQRPIDRVVRRTPAQKDIQHLPRTRAQRLRVVPVFERHGLRQSAEVGRLHGHALLRRQRQCLPGIALNADRAQDRHHEALEHLLRIDDRRLACR